MIRPLSKVGRLQARRVGFVCCCRFLEFSIGSGVLDHAQLEHQCLERGAGRRRVAFARPTRCCPGARETHHVAQLAADRVACQRDDVRVASPDCDGEDTKKSFYLLEPGVDAVWRHGIVPSPMAWK